MGKPAPPIEKTLGVFNAIGKIAFAYCCADVLIEARTLQLACLLPPRVTSQPECGPAAACWCTQVQDTLRQPPAAVNSMRKMIPTVMSLTVVLVCV